LAKERDKDKIKDALKLEKGGGTGGLTASQEMWKKESGKKKHVGANLVDQRTPGKYPSIVEQYRRTKEETPGIKSEVLNPRTSFHLKAHWGKTEKQTAQTIGGPW